MSDRRSSAGGGYWNTSEPCRLYLLGERWSRRRGVRETGVAASIHRGYWLMSEIDSFFRGYRLASELPADKRFLALSRLPQGRADLEALAWQLAINADRLADLFGAPQGVSLTKM
jgi:hypothetical protein